MENMPDFCITEIQRYHDCFFVDLPVTAFDVKGDMIMRLSVECSDDINGASYRVNVWASERRARLRYFIHTIVVPFCEEQGQAILDALSEDNEFIEMMQGYIEAVGMHRNK